ncbi:hypothetical protein L798_02878 [Zootermopsis nevadensis]|uniref:Uncharacterized protein n=1 Tax=Zootermopsis nevadensis TaxID=136037 RepID=A0A067QGX0_ZOONE|nr:hypothetical protein L798_02878 [Zootermopsis nevadensis]
MLFGDADITSDEVEHEAPGPKRGSGNEGESIKERSPDWDKHDENRSSVPFVGVEEAEEEPCELFPETRFDVVIPKTSSNLRREMLFVNVRKKPEKCEVINEWGI